MTTPTDDPTADPSELDAPPPLVSPWKTPQFWAVMIGAVISLLVGLGYLGPDFAKAHEQLVNGLAILAAALAPAIYSVARSISQHGHQQAVARVLVARLNAAAPPSVTHLHLEMPAPPVERIEVRPADPSPPRRRPAKKTAGSS